MSAVEACTIPTNTIGRDRFLLPSSFSLCLVFKHLLHTRSKDGGGGYVVNNRSALRQWRDAKEEELKYAWSAPTANRELFAKAVVWWDRRLQRGDLAITQMVRPFFPHHLIRTERALTLYLPCSRRPGSFKAGCAATRRWSGTGTRRPSGGTRCPLILLERRLLLTRSRRRRARSSGSGRRTSTGSTGATGRSGTRRGGSSRCVSLSFLHPPLHVRETDVLVDSQSCRASSPSVFLPPSPSSTSSLSGRSHSCPTRPCTALLIHFRAVDESTPIESCSLYERERAQGERRLVRACPT